MWRSVLRLMTLAVKQFCVGSLTPYRSLACSAFLAVSVNANDLDVARRAELAQQRPNVGRVQHSSDSDKQDVKTGAIKTFS